MKVMKYGDPYSLWGSRVSVTIVATTGKKIQETGKPQRTGDAEGENREEKENTEMKLRDRGKLFVGGLNHVTTHEGLKAYFSRFGRVVDAVVMTSAGTKRSRGYGFVTFADDACAEVARTAESHVIDGKAVDVRLFESNRSEAKFQKRNKDSRLFLGGIPLDMKEEDLKNFFSRYGKVTDLLIPHSREPKGYAFLAFEEKEAAEKCLSESFVYLGNKRVLIKKATARGGSANAMSEAEDGVECSGSDLESPTECGDVALSLPEDDGQSSASGDRTSLFDQYPGLQSTFENYFQPKIALCPPADPMENREEDQKWRPPVRDSQEMEKLLLSLLGESYKARGDTFPDEDVTDDHDDDEEGSYDDEESVSEEEEDGVYEDDDDDDDVLFEKGSAVDELSAKLKEILMPKIAEEKIRDLKSSVHENEMPALPSSSLPFTIKDRAGSLRCSLCHWTPPDGSCETFLAHCNTPEHRMKTKERFMPEDIQQSKPKKKSANLLQELDLRMVSPETRLNRIQRGLSEKQNEVQPGQDSKEQQKKKLPLPAEQIPQKQLNQQVPLQLKKKKPQQQPGQQKQQPQPKPKTNEEKTKEENQKQMKKKKTEQQLGQQIPQQLQQQKKTKKPQQPGQQTPQAPQQQIQKKNQNSENRNENGKIKGTEKIPELNLKVHALAKGMVCIQPVSQNELSCRMCNKVIPKAPDFGTLMKNVSSHLQSRRHLNKLMTTESSLKSALDKKPEEPVREQKNVSGKNTTTGKKEQGPAQKGMPKGKSPGPGNNCEKTDKKIPKWATATAAAAAPKVNFLCLSCNYFANRQETFNAHINSKVHSESVTKTNSKPSDFGPNSVLCKSCNRYLYGSLYDINKHHAKCSK